MARDCIFCGEKLQEVSCSGSIKGMQISFCDEHAAFCENCESVTCKIVK